VWLVGQLWLANHYTAWKENKKGTMQLVQGLFSGKKAPKLRYFEGKIV